MTELELKCLVEPSADLEQLLQELAQRVSLFSPQIIRVHDVYLDTRTRALAGAGLSARWRRKAGRSLLQVKPVPLIANLLFEREELELTLPRGANPQSTLRRFVEGRLALPLHGLPRPEVELRATRETYQIQSPPGNGEFCAELSLDRVTVLRPGARRGLPFVELELELAHGDRLRFAELAHWLSGQDGLRPSQQNKHQRALELLQLPLLELTPPTPRFEPLTPFDQVARLLCQHQLAAIEAFAAGTQVGLDPEYLHKMRVATRRLRAALAIFADCFAQRAVQLLQSGLKWLADTLGAVRDMDVQLLKLATYQQQLGAEPRAGWAQLQLQLEQQRKAARQQLFAALTSPRYQRLLQRAKAIFAQPAVRRRLNHPGRLPVGIVAQEVLNKRVRRVIRAAKRCHQQVSGENLHALRIRAKKLRYACEFFSVLYDESFRSRVKKLATFQDILGDFQDSVVLGHLVGELSRDLANPSSPGALYFVLGQLSALSRLTAETAEAELQRALQTAGGVKSLRKLRKKSSQLAETIATLAPISAPTSS